MPNSDNIKSIAKLFEEETKEFLDKFTGNAKYEVSNSLARASVALNKAVQTGNWAMYAEDMKFEQSVLASLASISADDAAQFLKESVNRAVQRGLAILFASI